MILNYIWVAFFLVAFVVALLKLTINGNTEVFSLLVNSAFDMAKTGFELSLFLTGIMTLWLGLMKVGEKGGMIKILSKAVSPFFSKLFPEVPKDHPAMGSMMMNFSANMLGLDNAATPLGLKAMEDLQELNPKKDSASNAQIMFLVLNTSGLTIIPISILVYRSQMGAANPSDVFIPILISTFVATLAGLIATSVVQKINLLNKTVLLYLGAISVFIASVIWYFSRLETDAASSISAFGGNFVLYGIIVLFISLGLYKKINVYETFIEGAKEGFSVAVKIIPYLVAMLVAIGVFRASGAMDILVRGIGSLVGLFTSSTEFVDALPTAFMKPLSGSGARGMMLEAMKTHGADSFVGRLSCMFQGSTETLFYTLAVYYGAVNIRNTRHTVACGLIAEVAGFTTAILLAYLFFG